MREVIQVLSRSAQPATTCSKAASTVVVQPQERSRARSDRRTTTSSGSRTARGSGAHQGTWTSGPGSTGTCARRTSRRVERCSARSSSSSDGQGKQPAR